MFYQEVIIGFDKHSWNPAKANDRSASDVIA